jgi:hypothetical protein
LVRLKPAFDSQTRLHNFMPYRDIEMQRRFQRERHAKIRAEFFAGKYCIDCGTTSRLELDHVDPTQKESHKIWTWSPERRAHEITKCVVRCHTCHVERHAKLMRKFVHGTATMYFKHDCRCADCIAAASKKRNEQRYRTGTRRPRSSVIEQGACTSPTSV